MTGHWRQWCRSNTWVISSKKRTMTDHQSLPTSRRCGRSGPDCQGSCGGRAHTLGRWGVFYLTIVQDVLVFGAETWVMNPRFGRILGGFRHIVAWRILVKQPMRRGGGAEPGSTPPCRKLCRRSIWKRWRSTYTGTRIRSHNTFLCNLLWTSAWRSSGGRYCEFPRGTGRSRECSPQANRGKVRRRSMETGKRKRKVRGSRREMGYKGNGRYRVVDNEWKRKG